MKNFNECGQILCNSQIEFIECAKFLMKNGQNVYNFNGEIFTKNLTGTWHGFSYDHESKYWGRFYSKHISGKFMEFKYLIRKDKLKKLNGNESLG